MIETGHGSLLLSEGLPVTTDVVSVGVLHELDARKVQAVARPASQALCRRVPMTTGLTRAAGGHVVLCPEEAVRGDRTPNGGRHRVVTGCQNSHVLSASAMS